MQNVDGHGCIMKYQSANSEFEDKLIVRMDECKTVLLSAKQGASRYAGLVYFPGVLGPGSAAQCTPHKLRRRPEDFGPRRGRQFLAEKLQSWNGIPFCIYEELRRLVNILLEIYFILELKFTAL